MAPKKYLPDVSWEDVRHVMLDNARTSGMTALVVIGFPMTGAPEAFVEVHLRPLGEGTEVPPTLTVRAPFPHRSPSRAQSAVMRAVWEAYGEYERNAWLWHPTRRKAARGE